jgi:hypothetical protein
MKSTDESIALSDLAQHMKSLLHITLKGSVFLLGWGLSCQVQSATPEEIIVGTGSRIDQVFQASAAKTPHALSQRPSPRKQFPASNCQLLV